MEAPERGALMLVRFVAVALIGMSAIELALYWIVCEHNHAPVKVFSVILKAIPFLLGIAALIKSKSLAEWVSSLLDD